jgi:hypothetical protein
LLKSRYEVVAETRLNFNFKGLIALLPLLALFLIMSKDPAFLFYSNDFLTGTYTMNDEQVGKFIRLLCLQHQKGELTEKDMLNVCKTYDEDIFSKFNKTEKGFYNERLRNEAEKRKLYSESRKNNRKKKDIKDISKTYVSHMENENENEIVNTKIKGIKPDSTTKIELTETQLGSCIEYLQITKNKKVSKENIKGLFEVFKVKEFTGLKYYNSEAEIYTHFLNSLKYEKLEDIKPISVKSNDDKAKQILNSI